MPKKLQLNVNLYFDPAYRRYHKADYVEKSFELIDEANKVLQLPSLDTKIELVASKQRLYNSTKRHRTLARNVKKVWKLLQPPFEVAGQRNPRKYFKTAHIYLTVGGIVYERSVLGSICSHDKPALSIVRSSFSQEQTAINLAHGIGHLLGMHHDHEGESRNGLVCADRPVSENLMSYGYNRKEWSECSNADFRNYYETIKRKDGRFCLEKM